MDFSDIMKMLKDPEALQRQAAEAQSRMASVTAVGSAGGGMVKVTLNGAMDMLAVEIAGEVVDPNDVPMLQDLVRAAYSDAAARVREAVQADLARSMGPGGIGNPFGQAR